MKQPIVVLHLIIGIDETKKVCGKILSWKLSKGGQEAVKSLIMDSRFRRDKKISVDEVLNLCDKWFKELWSQQAQSYKADPYDGLYRKINQGSFKAMYLDLGLQLPKWLADAPV